MNVEDRDTANISNGKSKRHSFSTPLSEEAATPRRSSRIRRTNTLIEFGCKKIIEANEVSPATELSKDIFIKPTNFTSSDTDAEDNQVGNENPPSVNKDVRKSSCSSLNSEEALTFETMFDDICDEMHSKSLQSFLPKELNDSFEKDIKILKTNSAEVPKFPFSSYGSKNGNIQPEDVDKVFKIISKPSALSDIYMDSKSSTKPPLKTYSNKKRIQKSNVIESFGLPDYPIVRDNVQPIIDEELDVALENVNEITILDLDYITEPWIITAEVEELFPILQEVRIKSEPKDEAASKTCSFFDFNDSIENLVEPTIFTSTPYNSKISVNKDLVCTDKNSTEGHKNKEIDIEAIKLNFKKILGRGNAASQCQESHKPKECDKTVLQKQNLVSKNSNLPDQNNQIKRQEFSNYIDVPRNPSFGRSEIVKCRKKSNPGHFRKKCNLSKKITYVNRTKKKSRNETVLSTFNRKRLLLSNNKECVGKVLPKKISETDYLISKSMCNVDVSNSSRELLQQNSTKSIEEFINATSDCGEFDNKRTLRSSSSHKQILENRKNLTPRKLFMNRKEASLDKKYANKSIEYELNDCGNEKESFLNGKGEVKTAGSSQNSLKTQTEVEENGKASQGTLRRSNKKGRSGSLDPVKQDKKANLSLTSKEQIIPFTPDMKMKIELQKCSVDCDLGSSINKSVRDTTINNQKTVQIDVDKLPSPVQKQNKSIPEIRVLLSPLDIFKFNEKMTDKALVNQTFSPKANHTNLVIEAQETTQCRKSLHIAKAVNSIEREENTIANNTSEVDDLINKKLTAKTDKIASNSLTEEVETRETTLKMNNSLMNEMVVDHDSSRLSRISFYTADGFTLEEETKKMCVKSTGTASEDKNNLKMENKKNDIQNSSGVITERYVKFKEQLDDDNVNLPSSNSFINTNTENKSLKVISDSVVRNKHCQSEKNQINVPNCIEPNNENTSDGCNLVKDNRLIEIIATEVTTYSADLNDCTKGVRRSSVFKKSVLEKICESKQPMDRKCDNYQVRNDENNKEMLEIPKQASSEVDQTLDFVSSDNELLLNVEGVENTAGKNKFNIDETVSSKQMKAENNKTVFNSVLNEVERGHTAKTNTVKETSTDIANDCSNNGLLLNTDKETHSEELENDISEQSLDKEVEEILENGKNSATNFSSEISPENIDKEQDNIESEMEMKSKVDDKLEKAEKLAAFNARLREIRRKLLEGKPSSTEELIKKSDKALPNELYPTKETNKASTHEGDTVASTVTASVTIKRKCSRVRGEQRKLADDMDLISRRAKEHKDKIQRSKSVAHTVWELRRKPNRSDIMEDYTDDMDLLNRYKKFQRETLTRKSAIDKTMKLRSHDKNKAFTSSSILNNTEKDDSHNDITGNNSYFPRNSLQSVIVDNFPDYKFKLGDIAWAQIGSYPFWPCLITKDPNIKCCKKTSFTKGGSREMYHVHFFGDKGKRAWIKHLHLMPYSSSEDILILKNKLKSENKPLPVGFNVNKKNQPKWKSAVEEAEELKIKKVKDRMSFFTNMFQAKSPNQIEPPCKDDAPHEVSVYKSLPKGKSPTDDANQTQDMSPPQKRSPSQRCFLRSKSVPLDVLLRKDKSVSSKRKFCELSKSDESNTTEETTEEISQVQKKAKRNTSSKKEVENDFVPSKEEAVVNINEHQTVENIIQQTENILSKMYLSRQIDEISEIGSKTSSENTTEPCLSSLESQKALYKRNNLFKGVSREKVCEYCCKPGDVLKCRGGCNGLYHRSCSLKILLEKSPRKRRDKIISSSNAVADGKKVEEQKNETKEKPNCGQSPDTTNGDTKMDNLDCLNGEINQLSENQVQIITVPSFVYNTPPRKTFPPNFKTMTLAEQIDYKMKEIMRKFESKTLYTYSFSESSSEEFSGNQVCTQVTPISQEKILVNEEKNAGDTVQKDITNLFNNIKKLETAETVKKPTNGNSKTAAKKNLFIPHVTADSEEVSNDLLQDYQPVEKYIPNCDNPVDPKNFKCGFCISDLYPYCFVCHQAVSKKGSSIRQRCSIYYCGRFYHPDCLKMWPQTQWSLIQTTKHKDSDKDMDSFVCPLHVCHTCVSDDPRAATSRCSGDKIVKCLRCPSTYHSSNLCVPAGTVILSSSQIICPRHREKNKIYTINTTWCFLCSEGGNLICCETCPTSVHPECLPVNLTDDDKFICEDCESGRLPLYDEIVWVKLGRFRWWPALILFPNEVPDNIKNMKHNIGEFVVKFFGTYDHYWVNRGRSFLFQEGDNGQCSSVKKKGDDVFQKAVDEAVIAHKLKKEFKLNQEIESINSLKPPPYIKIKVNKPVGNVRHLDLDLSSANACECDPNKSHPCGPESDCLNRLLMTECNPDICPAGTRCKNQSFEKREYPPMVPYKTQGRGWGLKTLAPIKKGQFVIEYVGELIDIEEYQRRIQKMHEQKEENYYFLTIDKDRMIDAGPKGNAARFMNHCCQPNCETQKWTVNGDTRVGLFATEDIAADMELTFNYNLECVGKERKVCRCGAPNCSGFIGVKAKQDPAEIKKPKKPIKKKVPVEPVVLPPCFICSRKGLVISCNNKICNKTYHQKCLKISREQLEILGNKFVCPWHNCNICSKRTIRCCVNCINSYCPSHSEGNIRYDILLGYVCSTHDPMTRSTNVPPMKFKRKKNDFITEETAVTSTTSDDIDKKDWESDNDSSINRSSTSLKSGSLLSYYDWQDEGSVSSATLTDGEEDVVKRKGSRPRKRHQVKKKIRLNNNIIRNTASSFVIENRLENNSLELSCRSSKLENR